MNQREQLRLWASRHGVTMAAIVDLLQVLDMDPVVPEIEAHVAAAEAGVQACVRVEVERWGGATWRNNSGVARERDVNTGETRHIRYGLGNDSAKLNAVFKSSDLIGVAPGGRFLAIECKARGWRYRGTEREVAQLNYIQRVRDLGGVAGFATSVREVAELVNA